MMLSCAVLQISHGAVVPQLIDFNLCCCISQVGTEKYSNWNVTQQVVKCVESTDVSTTLHVNL